VVGSKNAKITGSKIITLTQTPELRVLQYVTCQFFNHYMQLRCGYCGCEVLDVAAFERLMGPAMDIMKRNIAYYDDQMTKIFGSTAEDD